MKKSRLKADPAKTAAWQQRGRAKGLHRGKGLQAGEASLSREAPLKRGKGSLRRTRLKAGTPAPRVTTPEGVWLEVLQRDRGRCVWSRFLVGYRRAARAEHPHHLLPKGVGGWPEYAALRENIVALAADAHMQHEFSPNSRLPWEALPEECQAFLCEVAARDPRAATLVSVKYPAAGAQADHPIRRVA